MAKSRPTGRRGLPRAGLLPLGLLAAVAAGPSTRADGIPLGKFQFYPSVSVSLEEDDNLFNQNDKVGLGRVDDRTADLEALLVLQLPFRASLWELAYTPGLKRYQDNSVLDGDTHRVASELDLVFSTGSHLNMEGSYISDYSNLQQASAQLSESQFTFVNYEIVRARALYEQPFARRQGLEVILDFESLKFEDTDLSNLTDSWELELTVSYVHQLGRNMRVFFGAVTGTNDLDQPMRISDDECERDPAACLSRDALILRDQDKEDHWSSRGVKLGLERQFGDQDLARLDVGYQVEEFDHSDDSDFSGLVAYLSYDRRFSDALSVSAALEREPVQSSFDVNNYFLMQSATASVDFQPRGSSLYYFGQLSFQTNDYPDETQLSVNRRFDRRRENFLGSGFRRRDKIASMNLGVGIEFSEVAALDLSVSAYQRDSNLTPPQYARDDGGPVRLVDRSMGRLDYDDLKIGLTFRYGFLPQRNYI